LRERHRVVVVGSGPAAVACIFELIANNIKPLVLDSSNIEKFEDENLMQLPLKTYGGDLSTYRQLLSGRTDYEPLMMQRQTFSFGGFSRVWGATLDFPEGEEFPIDIIDNVKQILYWESSEVDTSYNDVHINNLIDRINKRTQFRAKRSKLAISSNPPNACRHSLKCFDKCPNNAIWFAGDVIRRFAREGKIDFRDSFHLDRIISKNGKSVLSFNSTNLEIEAEVAFVCIGPIGTASLLIRSNYKDEFILNDTHTIASGFLSLSTFGEIVPRNMLSKWWARSVQSPAIYLQVHQPSDIHLERIKMVLPKIFRQNWIARLLAKKLHPVLIFVDQSISGKVIVKKFMRGNEHQIRVSTYISKANSRIIREKIVSASRSFIKLGLYLPARLTPIGVPGDGYHTGAFLRNGTDIDDSGQLIGFKGIHILGSASLPTLPLGSITPTIMAHAMNSTRLALEKSNVQKC
jgi:hypothetical protein